MRALLALLLCCAALPLQADDTLELLSDDELAGVTGYQGVLLDIKLRNNVNASNAPIGCTVVIGTPNPCRIGLEFAARTGVWLMLKEYYGTLHLQNLRMDASFLPATNTAYFNSTRFQDTAGNCLITACNPNSDPAIKLTYPGTDGQTLYDDMFSFFNVGRAWLEFDLASPATPGYMRDTTLDSALGMRMADSSGLNSPARMRFWGTGHVYGF